MKTEWKHQYKKKRIGLRLRLGALLTAFWIKTSTCVNVLARVRGVKIGYKECKLLEAQLSKQ